MVKHAVIGIWQHHASSSTPNAMKTMLSFTLICLFATCAHGSGWVQGTNATQAGTTSLSASFSSLTVAGNFIICGVASASVADAFGIGDTQGNTWTNATGFYNGDGVHAVQSFYAKNIVGGADTITLTGILSTTHWLGCQEWYQVGLAVTTLSTFGTAANPACGNLAATKTNDGIAGFIVSTATSVTGPADVNTQMVYRMTSGATASMGMEYSIADQSGAAQPQFTAAAGTWTCISLELADSGAFVKNPNAKYGIVGYGFKYLTLSFNSLFGPNLNAWAHKVFDILTQPEAGSPYPYDANTASSFYEDTVGFYQHYQWYQTRSAAFANAGWDPERFAFHQGSDYEVTTNWAGTDGFDGFDLGAQAHTDMSGSVNGALIFNGTAYSDVSPTIYAGTCGAVCTLSNSGYFLYLGYAVPFDRMNFAFTTPMTGGTETWQYWNGTTWNTLTLATDGTAGLTTNGQIIFTPQPDWAMTKVNNGPNSKFWVRLSVGSPTIPPVIKTVKGDDWLAAAVIDFNGTTYQNCSTATDSSCLNSNNQPIPLTNTRYFGGSSLFTSFTPTVGVGNVAGTVTWQYWNGTAWTAFTPIADATNGFTVTGANTITLPTPPLTGWAKTIVPSEYNPMFYIRAQISGQTTAPTITDVDGIMNARGWCPACNHANTGLSGLFADLEYDPNPPLNQTAHFRHQARWANLGQNYIGLNTSDQQGSPAIYTYPQAMAGRWNSQSPTAPLYNGFAGDNAGGLYNNTNAIAPFSLNNVIEMACYPNCSTVNPPVQGLAPAMTALTALWHNPTSVPYGLASGTYDPRKQLTVFFNIVSILSWAQGTNGLRGTSDHAGIENAEVYANGSVFDAPTQYTDTFLVANGVGGGTCPSSGCNTSGQMGDIGFHHQQATLLGNMRVVRGSNTYWHTIDTATLEPMASLAAYKIAENDHTVFDLQAGGDFYISNDDYYPWLSTTTTLTAPITSGASGGSPTQIISVANASACPPIPGFYSGIGGTQSGQTWMQIGGVNGTSDVMRVISAGGNNFQQSNAANGNSAWVNSYPVGTVVRCAGIAHFSNSTPPPAANIYLWTSYFPAMNTDLGVQNTSGWMGGNRDMAFLAGNVVSPLGAAGCGASGCPPVERRDFTKAIVLFRPIQANTLDSETYTLSNNIGLTNSGQSFTPPYYRLNVDGTIGPAITSVQLRAGEAAILMTSGSPTAPVISSLSPSTGPVGTVVTIAGSNFTATLGTVTFGGVPATPTAWSDTSITVPVPAGAATGQVVVTSSTGNASNPVLFTVSAPTGPPTYPGYITGVIP